MFVIIGLSWFTAESIMYADPEAMWDFVGCASAAIVPKRWAWVRKCFPRPGPPLDLLVVLGVIVIINVFRAGLSHLLITNAAKHVVEDGARVVVAGVLCAFYDDDEDDERRDAFDIVSESIQQLVARVAAVHAPTSASGSAHAARRMA